jgi:membrane protein
VAGVIVALLFLFVSNLALLIGAEVDAELERVRQLRDGLEADSRLQLPLRATKRVERVERWRQDDLAYARELRRTRARSSREGGSPDS